MPVYEDTLNLKTMVQPRRGGIRPCIELEDVSHPLCVHFHRGLTIEEAQALAQQLMHGDD